jgi:hypothetical protein
LPLLLPLSLQLVKAPLYEVLASRYPKALALGLSALQDDKGL